MRIEAHLPDVPMADLARVARRVEELGFDGIAQPELRSDPFVALAAIATATARVRLATSVAIAFGRSPMVVAYTARNLQDLSGDRFALGLGTQVKGHVERRFSAAWGSPGPRFREYLLGLRAIWECWEQGTPLDFRGEFYRFTLMTPEFSLGPSQYGPIPVQTAAVNPYNIQLAGELADGLRAHPFSTPEYTRDVIWPNLRIGAARTGRSLEGFEVIGTGFIATGPDDAAVAAAREAARKRIAFYGSTRVYRPVLEHHGWGELGARLVQMVARGEWEALAGAVSDEVLDRFCVAAPYGTIAGRVEARLGGLVDWISLPFHAEESPARDRLGQALAELRAVPGRRDL